MREFDKSLRVLRNDLVLIYLDANSTSRLRPQVSKALGELLSEEVPTRNPSSVHGPGRRARALLRSARSEVMELLTCGKPTEAECVFLSGGTEACNQMVFGFLGPRSSLSLAPAHVLTSSVEHAAVSVPIDSLEESGWRVTRVSPQANGVIDIEAFVSKREPDTALVCLMLANNETGALQPVAAIAQRLREEGYQGPIVCDMIQALGKADCSIADLFAAGVNAVAVSAHKIGGPTGVGALAVSTSDSVCFLQHPLVLGGPQENRLRGGTENLLGIVGFGAAARVCSESLEGDLATRQALRELLWQEISQAVPEIRRLGPDPRDEQERRLLLSNTLLLQVSGCRGDDLVAALDLAGIACSTGSACSSGRQEVSQSVRALGLVQGSATEVLRLSLDWDCSESTVVAAADIFARTVLQMRNASGWTASSSHAGAS